ncbi:MAG: hypothetical protein Q4A10_02370 [Aerococcaceae bacterium]|nr:hypothetical protein [Aerococcaceae bacterium]
MELRITPSFSERVFQSMKQYTDALLSDNSANADIQPFIMPMWQVECMLHEHYVSQQPITITFEYYKQQRLVEKTIRTFVKSPIRPDRRIVLEEIGSPCDFLLLTEQILRVKK